MDALIAIEIEHATRDFSGFTVGEVEIHRQAQQSAAHLIGDRQTGRRQFHLPAERRRVERHIMKDREDAGLTEMPDQRRALLDVGRKQIEHMIVGGAVLRDNRSPNRAGFDERCQQSSVFRVKFRCDAQ